MLSIFRFSEAIVELPSSFLSSLGPVIWNCHILQMPLCFFIFIHLLQYRVSTVIIFGTEKGTS